MITLALISEADSKKEHANHNLRSVPRPRVTSTASTRELDQPLVPAAAPARSSTTAHAASESSSSTMPMTSNTHPSRSVSMSSSSQRAETLVAPAANSEADHAATSPARRTQSQSRRLAKWHDKTREEYLVTRPRLRDSLTPPLLGYAQGVSIKASDIKGLVAAVVTLMIHIHHHGVAAGSTSLPLPINVSELEPVKLEAFLYNRRSYSLTQTATGNNPVFPALPTVGEGLERSVWHQVPYAVVADKNRWQVKNGYYIPTLSPMALSPLTDEKRAGWMAHGAICALHLVYYGTGPQPISPFVLLAALLGKEGFRALTSSTIASLDQGAARDLEPWFKFNPTETLTQDYRSDFGQFLISVNLQVIMTLYAFE